MVDNARALRHAAWTLSLLSTTGLCTDALAQTGSPVATQGVTAAAAADTESSGDTLQEVVVTAQKRSESAQKVPIAIEAISPAQLQMTGVQTTLDLGNAVPGMTLLDIGGQVSPRIRGVGSTSIAPGQESPVAMVVDGVYYASSSDVSTDLFDVSQIAVLKGPQGTLFGRNATGGVIQITTRDPGSQFQVDLATSLDNYLTSRTEIYLGGPITPDLKGGLAVQYTTQGDGWGKNIFNDEYVHRIDDDVSARGKLIFAPTDTTTIRLAADFATRAGTVAGIYHTFPGYPEAYASPVPGSPWDIDSYIQPRNTYTGGGTSLTVAQDFGFATLTSISAYRQSQQYWAFNPALTAVPSLDLQLYDFSNQITQELQLVSRNDSALTWAVGAFYIYNDAGQQPPGEIIYIRPGPYRGDGPFSQVNVLTEQWLRSPAAFAQATYKVTSSTRVTAGIRYTYEKKVLEGSETADVAATPGVTVPIVPAGTTDLVSEKPTWRFAVDHDLAPDVIAYFSYNRGFKSGGFNVRDPTNPPFQPEQLDAYEVGLKSEFWDDRARLNAAAFYYDYKNIQVARYVTNTIIYNGARAGISGLDLDGEVRLTSRWHVNGGIEYLHSRFKDFPDAFSSSYVLTPQGATIDIFTQSATGNTLPYSPAVTYNVSIDYEQPSPIGPLHVNLTDSYSSHFYAEPDNLLTQPSYHFLNFSMAWKSPSERYGLRLYVNNILNKAVASQFGSLPTGYEADYPNPPRIYGVKLQASF
jgi:iron complex outermembrane receptor protein